MAGRGLTRAARERGVLRVGRTYGAPACERNQPLLVRFQLAQTVGFVARETRFDHTRSRTYSTGTTRRGSWHSWNPANRLARRTVGRPQPKVSPGGDSPHRR